MGEARIEPFPFGNRPTHLRARWGMSDRGRLRLDRPPATVRRDFLPLRTGSHSSREQQSRVPPSSTSFRPLRGAVRSSPVLVTAIEAAVGAARTRRKDHHHGDHRLLHLDRQRLQRRDPHPRPQRQGPVPAHRQPVRQGAALPHLRPGWRRTRCRLAARRRGLRPGLPLGQARRPEFPGSDLRNAGGGRRRGGPAADLVPGRTGTEAPTSGPAHRRGRSSPLGRNDLPKRHFFPCLRIPRVGSDRSSLPRRAGRLEDGRFPRFSVAPFGRRRKTGSPTHRLRRSLPRSSTRPFRHARWRRPSPTSRRRR